MLKSQPKEILLGLVVNTEPTPIEVSAALVTPPEIDIHMAYTTDEGHHSLAQKFHNFIKLHKVYTMGLFNERI